MIAAAPAAVERMLRQRIRNRKRGGDVKHNTIRRYQKKGRKKMKSYRKILALILVLVLVAQVFPFSIFAENAPVTEPQELEATQEQAQISEENHAEAPQESIWKVQGGEVLSEQKVSAVEAESPRISGGEDADTKAAQEPVCEYTFAPGVIEIPLGTDVTIADEDDGYAITIKNYKAEIPAGSTIAVYVNYLAYVFAVESVEYGDEGIVVHSHYRPTNAILSARESYSRGVSYDELELCTGAQVLTTEDGKEVEVRSTIIGESDGDLEITFENNDYSIKVTLHQLNLSTGFNYEWFWPDDSTYHAILTGDVDVTIEKSKESSLTLHEGSSLELFSWSPSGTRIDKVTLSLDLSGSLSVKSNLKVRIGCEGKGLDPHLINEVKISFEEIEIEASLMLNITGSFDIGIASLEMKAGIGPVVNMKLENHPDGNPDGSPMKCLSTTISIELRGEATVEIPILDVKVKWEPDAISLKKFETHRENGVYVPKCTYVPGGAGGNHTDPGDPGDPSDPSDPSYPSDPSDPGNPGGEPYVPEPMTGEFAGSQPGVQSQEPTNIWEFVPNDDGENTITITKYKGSASVLTVPNRIVIVDPEVQENDGHVEYFVTRIGDNAFLSNRSLRAVTVSEGIESIGEAAFWSCTSLENIELPESLVSIGFKAFDYCCRLKRLKLPHNLTSVSICSFGDCPSLEYVYIPKRLCNEGSVGDYLFNCCENLKEIEFEAGVTRIPRNLFECCNGLENIVIPDTVTEIGWCAFENCTGLMQISLPKTLETIGSYAFRGCKNLTSVKLPDAINSLGDETFRGCISLTHVSLPESLKSIGNRVFKGCTALTSVSLPDSIEKIGAYAFDGCSSLTSLKCGFDLDVIDAGAFNGCTKLASVELNYGLRVIGTEAFRGCEMLERISIPESVNEVYAYAFRDCTSLQSVVLSRRIQTIMYNTFQNCEALTDLVLPNGVKSISQCAFNNAAIERITIPETVTSIDASAFTNPENITVYGVPGSTAEAFANSKDMIFVAIPETERVKSMQLVNDATQIIVPYGKLINVNPDWFTFAPANHLDQINLVSSNAKIASVISGNQLKGVRNGTARVTATASNGLEYSFDVAVKRLDSIEITHLPNKIAYAYGEPFCWDGLEVTAVFEDGSRQKLEKGIYDLRGFSSTSGGVKTMTASWCEKEASFEVTVDGPELFTVTFVNWDGTVLKTETVKNGDMATAPRTPSRLCYNFTGWDRDFSNVTENMMVTAQYVEAHDYESAITEPTCTEQGYTTYTCSRCGDAYTDEATAALGHAWDEGVVTLEPTFETEGVRTYTCTRCGATKTEAIGMLEWVNPFVDVSEEDYFYIPVLWAVYHDPQITAGTDATHFSPNNTVTRAEAMMILYAAKGRPAYEKPNVSFSDVKKKHWAYDAIMWAVANGITGGTSDTTFSPTKTCNRSEILTFLYAAMEKPGYSIANPYTDVKNKHWYKDAAIWAYEAGIEKGQNGKFLANTPTSRAAIVTYIYRFETGLLLCN